MKREHAVLTSADTTPDKKAKVTKGLSDLLKEVSIGDYEDFRTWLVQENRKSLNSRAINVNVSHLGKALQNTAISRVSLRASSINDAAAKDFGLALKGSSVTHVDLCWNDIGAQGVKDFGQALKDTGVTQVDLSFNRIGDEGVKALLTSLAGSKVRNIDLRGNNITENAAHEIAKLIEHTHLFKLNLGFEHPAITAALLKNRASIHVSPYEFARIHLLGAQKKQTLIGDKYPALTENSTTQDEIEFVACTLANVPVEIAYQIISFLPFMNSLKVEKIFAKALERPAVIIDGNKSVDDESLPRSVPRVF